MPVFGSFHDQNHGARVDKLQNCTDVDFDQSVEAAENQESLQHAELIQDQFVHGGNT